MKITGEMPFKAPCAPLPRTLMPNGPRELQHDLRLTGLALAAMEKSVQIVYERGLRPPEKLHVPWVERVTGQLLSAYGELDVELGGLPIAASESALRQGGVTVGVAWHFTQQRVPEAVPCGEFPCLPAFQAAPHGDGTCRGDI